MSRFAVLKQNKILFVIISFFVIVTNMLVVPVQASSQNKEIVFIENNLMNYDLLVDEIGTNVEVYVLDAKENGLNQITEILAGRRGIHAIHLISHGKAGEINLGTMSLSSGHINDYGTLLMQIGEALREDGDILIYGCNVAQEDVGRVFVENIAHFTNADVAASNDLTGSADKGGNWTLEFSKGIVNTNPFEILNYTTLLNPMDSVMTSPTLNLSLNRPEDPDNDNYYAQTAAGLPNGDIAVLYYGYPAANGYVEFLNVSGNVLGKVELTTGGGGIAPHLKNRADGAYISAMGDGNAFVYYTGSDNNAYFTIIGRNGAVRGETLIKANSTVYQAQELSNGNLLVTVTSGGNVYIYTISPQGSQINEEAAINGASFPWAAANGFGKFIVPYKKTSDGVLYAKTYYNDGTIFAEEFPIDSHFSSANSPWAVNLSNGNFVIAFESGTYGSGGSSYFRIFQPNGTPVGASVNTGDYHMGSTLAADLTVGQEGFVFLTWDGSGGIYAIRFNNDGNIVAGGTQTGYGALTIANSGAGIKTFQGAEDYRVNSNTQPWQGYSSGVVAVFVSQTTNNSVIQTWELPAPVVNSAPSLTATAVGGSSGGSDIALFSDTSISVGAGDNYQKIHEIQLKVSGLSDDVNEVLEVDGTDVALTDNNSIVTNETSYLVNVSKLGNEAMVTFTRIRDFDTSLAQVLIDSLKYKNTAATHTTGPRTFTLARIQDNGGISGGGTDTATLNIAASVTVGSAVAPSITKQPSSQTVTLGENTDFTVEADGSDLTYQWQVNKGLGFEDISEGGGVYSGFLTDTLNIIGAVADMDGYVYRVVVTGSVSPAVTSNEVDMMVSLSVIVDFNISGSAWLPISTVTGTNLGSNTVTEKGYTFQYHSESNESIYGFNDKGEDSTPAILLSAGSSGTETLTITSALGNTFQFTSFYLDNVMWGESWDLGTWAITGKLGGQTVGSQTLSTVSGGTKIMETNTNGTTLQNVDTIIISSATGGFNGAFLDSFVLDPPIVPAGPTVPGAPTGVTSTRGNGRAIIKFRAPIEDGGSPITGYKITVYAGDAEFKTVDGLKSPVTVTGLTNGTEYTFKVSAGNLAGEGEKSEASAPITPATIPGSPTNVTSTVENGQATLNFDQPANDGGAPITQYIVIAEPGGITVTGTGSPITISGLTNGKNYKFTIKAKNAAGTSVPAYSNKN